jgi:hypothetical protein
MSYSPGLDLTNFLLGLAWLGELDRRQIKRLWFVDKNDTEPLGVIAGKARAYRRLVEDNAWAAWWQQRYGPLPIPLWVVPSDARAKTVHNQWKRAWPDGRWLIATDEGLQQNEMLSWERRNEAYVTIGFKPLQPKLPAPPAQAPAQPQQVVVAALPAPPPASPALPGQQAPVIGPPQTVAMTQASARSAITPVPSPAPSHMLSPTPAAPPRGILPAPALPNFEATLPQQPARSTWLAIAWEILCWVASLLWATLRLPWRSVRTYLPLVSAARLSVARANEAGGVPARDALHRAVHRGGAASLATWALAGSVANHRASRNTSAPAAPRRCSDTRTKLPTRSCHRCPSKSSC